MTKDQIGAIVLVLVAAAAALIGWAAGAFDGEPRPAAYDAAQKSVDLPQDLKLMWESGQPRVTTEPARGPAWHAASDRAINAASRVFNTIRLVGRSRSDVVALLGKQILPISAFGDAPLDSTADGPIVYRFDSGAYGWEFDVLFDANDKVSEVQRQWFE